MIPQEEWVWMPHPGHFICAFDCRFHLSTKIGNIIVSTVGELFPDSNVRDILAHSRGIELNGIGDERKNDYLRKIGYDDIGHNRKYETMVFPAEKRANCPCCPWRIVVDDGEKEMRGYNHPGDAYEGHMELCRKWAAL